MLCPLRPRRVLLLLLLLLVTALAPALTRAQIYVDADATGANDGTSWTDAYTDLQDALADADGTDEIWIAEGTYTPTSGSDRSVSFTVTGDQEGLKIYGGFEGTEMNQSEREPSTHEVVLSGDIGVPGDSTDNSYHVLFFDAPTGGTITNDTVLDGVTVTDGQAVGSIPHPEGGGLLCRGFSNGNKCSPTISNVVFESNAAEEEGGALNDGAGSPTLTDVIFRNNEATFGGGAILISSDMTITNALFLNNSSTGRGGAIYNSGGSPTIENAVFHGNESETLWGGAIFTSTGGALTIVNTTFSNNTAVEGGAIFVGSTSPVLTNVTFTGNSAEGDEPTGDPGRGGGALLNENAQPTLTNAILWGNSAENGGDEIHNVGATPTVRHSIYEGGCAGHGNDCGSNVLAGDPLFKNAADPNGADDAFRTADDGLRLFLGSPAVDAGDDDALPSGVTTDVAGASRVQDGDEDGTATVDVGAYEHGPGPAETIYVDANATGANDGTSWPDAYVHLHDALVAADGNDELWIAEGTYYPDDGVGQTPDDRSASFRLTGAHDGLKIYGGFASGDSFADRNPADHPVVLSGNVGAPDDATDNSSHVLDLDGTTPDGGITRATVIDGLTVSGGYADGLKRGGGLACDALGAGSICSPTIRGVIFASNRAHEGGALTNTVVNGGESKPKIVNTVFTGNTAVSSGGAIFTDGSFGESDLVLVNVTLANNQAPDGGALYNDGEQGTSRARFDNVVTYGNTASASGTDVVNNSASLTLSHTLIEAGANGIQEDDNSSTTFEDDNGNSVPFAQSTNLNADPLFADANDPDGADDVLGTADDGLGLRVSSPALDTGDDSAVPSGVTTDVTDAPRIQDADADGTAVVDLGAYERATDTAETIYVDANASGANDGTSWSNAYLHLQDALASATGNDELWIAEGTYHPDEGANETDGDRLARFRLTGAHDGLKIYGGFAGGESSASQRDPEANPVILSGDIDQDDGPFAPTTDSDGNADTPTQIDHINGTNSVHVLHLDGTTANGPLTSATVLDGVTVTGGQANKTDSNSIPDQSGGGLYCEGQGSGHECSPTLANVTVSGNAAILSGGGIYLTGWDGGASRSQMIGTTFIGNHAVRRGGAVYGNAHQFNAATGTINISIADATFSDNRVNVEAPNGGGGGIYIRGDAVSTSRLEIEASTFSGNEAAGDFEPPRGGAIYSNHGALVITNTTFGDNGAIYTGDQTGQFGLSSFGGAIFHSGGPLTITGTVFTDNEATGPLGGGGALYVGDTEPGGSSSTIASTLLVDNTANTSDGEGGAIQNSVASAPSNLQITNVTFTGNTAANGGGLVNTGSADGGDTGPALTNVILHGNTATGSGAGHEIHNEGDGATPTLRNTLIEGGLAGISENDGASTTDGGNNLDALPGFVDPGIPAGHDGTLGTSDDGLRLRVGSPALNAGDDSALPSGVTTDITGANRIQDGTVDLGAYEGGVAFRLYVDGASGSDADDGRSWNAAFATLQKALAEARAGETVWIAEGTYYPDEGPGVTDDDRSARFRLTGAQDGLQIYGGFENGDAFADRAPSDHPVILSGDIDQNDGPFAPDTDSDGNAFTPSQTDHLNGGNSYHVLALNGTTGGSITSATVLDGLTVTAGQADAAGNRDGAGLLCNGEDPGNACSPTISQSVFKGNAATLMGGAVANNGSFGGASSPTLTNVVFVGNSANGGGALHNNGQNQGASSPQLTNVVFVDNFARFDGGAIHNFGDDGTTRPSMTGVTFFGNEAGRYGGALYNDGRSQGAAEPEIVNAILWGNSADDDGAVIYNDDAGPVLRYTIVEGGTSGIFDGPDASTTFEDESGTGVPFAQSTNLDADPHFVDAGDPGGPDDTFGTPDDGLRPMVQRSATPSPALDAGDNSALPSGVTADLAGTSRRIDLKGLDGGGSGAEPIVDLGAYEARPVAPTVTTGSISDPPVPGLELSGTVNAGGAETTVEAEVFPVDHSSNVTTVTASASPVVGVTDQSVTVSLTGLPAATEYEARLVASNDAGSDEGALQTFTTEKPDTYTRTIIGTNGTGNDTGWRLLALPAAGATQADLEDNLDFNVDSGHLLHTWTSNGWAPAQSSTSLSRGTGFILYFFDDSIDPIDSSDGITLDVGSGPEDLSADRTVSGLAQSDRFHLLGNPYDTAFDLSALAGGDLPGAGFQATVQVWDPDAGQFRTITQGTSDDEIAAWQGFFVERSTVDQGQPNLTFGASGRQSDRGALIGSKASAKATASPTEAPASPKAGEEPIRIPLDLTVTNATDTVASSSGTVLVSERASAGWDAYEATQLAPPTAETYAQLGSPLLRSGAEDSTLVHRALASEPLPTGSSSITVPLSVRSVGVEGQATIRWREAAQQRPQLPEWDLELEDTETGARVDLKDEAYRLDVAAGDGAIETPGESRFRLHVRPPGVLPVEMARFEAAHDRERVRLTWQTASETNNVGFAVQRRVASTPGRRVGAGENGSTGAWEQVGFVEGAGTTTEPQTYRFTDADLPYTADSLVYRLRQIDANGTAHLSEVVTVQRGAVDRATLQAPFPNPARQRATLQYAVPKSMTVEIAVYDVLGRRVATWADGRVEAGRYERSVRTGRLASGMYFVRLQAGNRMVTHRLAVVH